MSAQNLEAFLAKIYVDEKARAKFLADPCGEARLAGLSEQEMIALEKIDKVGLELTVESLQRKRLHRHK